MEQVIQSLTRLKLTGSPVMQPPSTSEHEFPVTGVRRRLNQAEGCAKGISSFEWIIKQSAAYNRAYRDESPNVFLLTYKPIKQYGTN